MVKNFRPLVRVLHCPKHQIDGRVVTFEKGHVIAPEQLGADDIHHLLRAGHIEETDELAGPPAPGAATEEPTQEELVKSLDADLAAEQHA